MQQTLGKFHQFIWSDWSARFFFSYDCFKQCVITLKAQLISIENTLSGTALWRCAPATKCYVKCDHIEFYGITVTLYDKKYNGVYQVDMGYLTSCSAV